MVEKQEDKEGQNQSKGTSTIKVKN